MKVRRVDFSPDEWISGVTMLTDAERGVYIQVLMGIYSRGGPIDLDHARSLCGRYFNAALSRLVSLGKLTVNDRQVDNKRAAIELQNAANRAAMSRQNGVKGNEIRWKGIATLPPDQIANHQPSTTNHQPSPKERSETIVSPRARAPKPGISAWEPNRGHHDLADELGHDDRWLVGEEQRYRDWLPNAKSPHKDFDAGFRNWLRRASKESAPKGTNGHDILTAANKRFILSREATFRAAERRERDREAATRDGQTDCC